MAAIKNPAGHDESFRIPRIVIAGTHSGCGKTTITRAVMAALVGRGCTVQPFKIGPDFIDPSHHTRICGRVSRNLDLMMAGEEGILETFVSGCRGADIAVIEGVMGMFDGLEGSPYASTAHVSRILGAPVMLVVDVKGMSSSVHAISAGYATYDPSVDFAGVILNRVGSDRHRDMLSEERKYPHIGYVRKIPDISVKSRHLGLMMGGEVADQAGDLVQAAEEIDLDEVIRIAVRAPPVSLPEPVWAEPAQKRARIGVARDAAFCFYYENNIESLVHAGAEIVPFSPLTGTLPDVDGVYLGGGYPELFREELASSPVTGALRSASGDGLPVYGECGGLLYLTGGIGPDRWVGVLPGETFMEERFQALGYSVGESTGAFSGMPAGMAVRGHEFHYSRVEPGRDAKYAIRLSRGQGIAGGMDGLYAGGTIGAYTHAWFSEEMARALVSQAERYQRS